MLRSILIILALFIPIVSLKYFILPFVWICLAWFIVFLHATKVSKNNIVKAVWFNFAVVIIVLGSFEIYLYIKSQSRNRQWNATRVEFRDKEGDLIKRSKRHDVLGYAPIKNQTGIWKSYHLNELIFDISHTIDENGLRVSPPDREENNMECVLFFGGSITFGDGLNDYETMPYLTGLKTKGKFRIYNFGFSGYGPHQMLAAIQNKMVEDIIDCEPRYVIYQSAAFHVPRIAGLSWWDKHGPKYKLRGNGEIEYKGHFDNGNIFFNKINKQLKKSFIIDRISFKLRYNDKDNIPLMIAIIDSSKTILETSYPNCEFHVIFWDYDKDWMSNEILIGLNRKAIKVHLISDIVPDFNKEKSKYILHKFDDHPNQLINEKIAEYVSSKILKNE